MNQEHASNGQSSIQPPTTPTQTSPESSAPSGNTATPAVEGPPVAAQPSPSQAGPDNALATPVSEPDQARGGSGNGHGPKEPGQGPVKSPPETGGAGIGSFLFVASFALLLGGLYLIRSHVSSETTGLTTILGFLAVQHVYEFLLLGCGLYLIVTRRHRENGSFLLLLLPFLLFDITSMHHGTTELSAATGRLTAIASLLLAAIKVGMIMAIMAIRVHWDRLAWLFSGLTIVLVSPLLRDVALDSFGVMKSSIEPMRLYGLWLCAALAAIPFLIKNEMHNTLIGLVRNRYLANELPLQRGWLYILAVVVPWQLASHHGLPQADVMTAPYLVATLFLTGILFQRGIRELVGRNEFHFLGLFGMFWLVQFADYKVFETAVAYLNQALVMGSLLATTVFMKNIYSGGFLGAIALYHGGATLSIAAQKTYVAARGLSRLAWGILLLSGSFLFLVLGFLVSLKGNNSQDRLAEG